MHDASPQPRPHAHAGKPTPQAAAHYSAKPAALAAQSLQLPAAKNRPPAAPELGAAQPSAGL